MTKAQKFFKGVFYYSLIILALAVTALQIGAVISYTEGFRFIFSVTYGFEAVRDFIVFFGLIGLMFLWPFIIYVIGYMIFLHFKPICKQLRLKDYLKSIKFYIPLFIVSGLLVLIVGINEIQYAVKINSRSYYTSNMNEALRDSVVYNVPYNSGLEEYEGRIIKMNSTEVLDLFNNYYSNKNQDEEVDCFVKYITRLENINDDFVVIFLPIQEGRAIYYGINEAYEIYGSKKNNIKLRVVRDTTSDYFMPCIIISERIYPYSFRFDDDTWKTNLEVIHVN